MNTFWQSVRFNMGLLKRSALTFFGLIIFASVAMAHSAPDLLFQYHFVGGKNIGNTTNSAKLKEIWELPETKTLVEQALGKFALTAGNVFSPGKTNDQKSAELIRPLLDDLFSAESLMEVRKATNGSGEILFAIKLSPERATLWQSNLEKAVSHHTRSESRKSTWEKFSGWEIKRNVSPALIRVLWTGNWLVLGIGENELPLQNNVLRRLATGNIPAESNDKTNWLEATVDFPKLDGWLPLAQAPFKLAKTEIEVSSRGENLRTFVRATYPQPLNWKSERWQIPTNTIRDPLISFTAAQNLSVLMKTPELFKQAGINPLTNQFYLWSQGHLPFLSYGAMPVKNASNALHHLGKRLPEIHNAKLAKENAGQIIWDTNRQEIVWAGLPMIVPHLRATNELSGQFIAGGFFPITPSKDAIPHELVDQVASRTNLIFYDWEITQFRLGQWQMLSKMVPGLVQKPTPVPAEKIAEAKTNAVLRAQLSNRLADERWQAKVAPLLGNTVTEVTLVAPNQIELVRKSHIGFSAVELLHLSRWLKDPVFPFSENRKPSPASGKK